MPPRKLTSLRAKAAAAEKEQEADAAQQDRAAAADANDPSPPATDAAHEPQSSSSSSATATRAAVPTVKPRPAFKPNSAVEARAKQTKDVFQSEDGPAPPRERRDPTQRRPRREMPPRPRIEDTMLPSNLTGNIKASGASGSKGGGGGGFARAAAGAGAGNITTGFAGADVKLETQHAGSAAATATNFLPFSSDLEAKDLVGTLDERDLFMIADGFGVDDDDAPVSLGWSRKVRDREHFLAGKKAASEVKADSMDLDPDGNAGNELQSFNEFVQPEPVLREKIPLRQTLTPSKMKPNETTVKSLP
ncbi:hypothetical protein HDU82_008133 [Entophlyctis luteolus]|nr:hypothetical protein HDU82_008133 [Entophlyctis luteolus]